VAEPRLSAVRRALGDDADRVRLADMAELGHNPARIIPAWREFTRGAGGRPIRGVGEPIWSGRRNAEIVECQFHEALLNMAVAPTTPLWLLCPYDVGSLDDAVLAEARHSHPVLVESGDSTASSDYGDISHVLEMFAATLPEPQTRVTALTVAAERHHEVADRVQSWAATAGLPAQQSTKLAVAIDEIARAGIGSDGRDVNLRFWRDEAALVCEVTDAGVIGDPMVGRSEFFATDSRDRGIRIANELCDLVQVRSNSAGTAVRVHSWL
jgi:anti-sigma regulatory factor (Ser/Thr protein kinase)